MKAKIAFPGILNDISTLSDKELEALSAKSAEILAARETERKAKLERKRSYVLITPEPTYSILYPQFYEEAMKLGAADPELKDKLLDIEKKCSLKKQDKKEDIYPCPECGEMSLRPGVFGGDEWSYEYKIICDSCSFTAPVKAESSKYDAWDNFHEWLVKEGYLEKC